MSAYVASKGEEENLTSQLIDNYDFLARRVRVENIFDRLRAKRAINEPDEQRIKARETDLEKSSSLIDTVIRNGLLAIKAYFTCLEYEYGDVYFHVTGQEPSEPPPEWTADLKEKRKTAVIEFTQQILEELRTQEKKKEAGLHQKVIDLQDQLLSKVEECFIKQNDISKLLHDYKSLEKDMDYLKSRLNEAENIKDRYMKEINTLRLNQYRHADHADLDPFQQMLSERNAYKAKASEQEQTIEELRMKVDKEEERRSAAEDNKMKYRSKWKNLTRQLSKKSALEGEPLGHNNIFYRYATVDEYDNASGDSSPTILLEPHYLQYPDLRDWNNYTDVTEIQDVEIESDYLKDTDLIGGNMCGIYVSRCPKSKESHQGRLQQADELIKITTKERYQMAEKTTAYDMSNICLDTAKSICEKLARSDTEKVTVTKKLGSSAHREVESLLRKGLSGGDCFCVNILQGQDAEDPADLALRPGMILMVTHTDYKTDEATSGGRKYRRYWYGHELNPKDAEKVGKSGRFASLIGSGRMLKRSRSSSAERVEFRYVYPCKAKRKRPVTILAASDKQQKEILKVLSECGQFYLHDTESNSNYDNVVSGVTKGTVVQYTPLNTEPVGCLTLEEIINVVRAHDEHVLLPLDLEAIGRMVRARMTPIVIVVKQKGAESLEVERSLENHLILQPYEYSILELTPDELTNRAKLSTYVSTFVSEIQDRVVWVEDNKPVEPI